VAWTVAPPGTAAVLDGCVLGDLDYLLLDLPPGTGDIALSIPQLLPESELLIVTTPQAAAAEVAERAGMMAVQTKQKVAGVIENMSWMDMPDGSKVEMFGSGGGLSVAMDLTRALGYPHWCLGPGADGCASSRRRR